MAPIGANTRRTRTNMIEAADQDGGRAKFEIGRQQILQDVEEFGLLDADIGNADDARRR